MVDPVGLLKDLITAAAVSLSPAGAWAAFSSNWSWKENERRQALRTRLFELKQELNHIAHWAQTEYTDDAHGDNWRNPQWAVNDFPTHKIQEFNHTVDASGVGRPLVEAMVRFEASIARFRALLVRRQHFIWQGGGSALLGPEYGLAPETADPSFPFRVSTAWLDEVYNLSKEIHVRGIGTPQSSEGLHVTWKQATTEVERETARMGKAAQPWFMWLGHILATIVGLVGVGFLVSFIIVFFNSVSWPSGQ